MRWRLILEEYGPTLHYIKGDRNIVADALSRIGMVKEPVTDNLPHEATAELYAAKQDDPDFPLVYPLSYAEIQYMHRKDAALMKKLKEEHKPPYIEELFPFGDETFRLITKGGKSVLPKSLQTRAV